MRTIRFDHPHPDHLLSQSDLFPSVGHAFFRSSLHRFAALPGTCPDMARDAMSARAKSQKAGTGPVRLTRGELAAARAAVGRKWLAARTQPHNPFSFVPMAQIHVLEELTKNVR